MNIDWKKKLTSRKFWLAIIGFVTPLLIAFGVSENTVTEIAGIIMSGASCIAYVIGEGMVDAEHIDVSNKTNETNNTNNKQNGGKL